MRPGSLLATAIRNPRNPRRRSRRRRRRPGAAAGKCSKTKKIQSPYEAKHVMNFGSFHPGRDFRAPAPPSARALSRPRNVPTRCDPDLAYIDIWDALNWTLEPPREVSPPVAPRGEGEVKILIYAILTANKECSFLLGKPITRGIVALEDALLNYMGRRIASFREPDEVVRKMRGTTLTVSGIVWWYL